MPLAAALEEIAQDYLAETVLVEHAGEGGHDSLTIEVERRAGPLEVRVHEPIGRAAFHRQTQIETGDAIFDRAT